MRRSSRSRSPTGLLQERATALAHTRWRSRFSTTSLRCALPAKLTPGVWEEEARAAHEREVRSKPRPLYATMRHTRSSHRHGGAIGGFGALRRWNNCVVPGDRYVALLERENEFLRGQVATMDDQIRQANIFTRGLQRLIGSLAHHSK
jgi:hypothetical protein